MAPCLYSSSTHSTCRPRGNILIVKSIFTLFVRNAWSCAAMSNPSLSYFSFPLLTLGRTRKVITPSWYKGKRGEGVDGPHPLEFLKFRITSKRFCLQWKAFDLVYKMRYMLLVVSLLEACDVTKKVGAILDFFTN